MHWVIAIFVAMFFPLIGIPWLIILGCITAGRARPVARRGPPVYKENFDPSGYIALSVMGAIVANGAALMALMWLLGY